MAGQGCADGLGGGRTAYAIRLARSSHLGSEGTLIGTSALSEADLRHESIHLGSTHYGSRWWGTQINPGSKLLLLTHCFEDCGYGRVKIQTDTLNTRSQAAITKPGAQREGILRRHLKREDGTFRDSVIYSVLKEGPQAGPPRIHVTLIRHFAQNGDSAALVSLPTRQSPLASPTIS